MKTSNKDEINRLLNSQLYTLLIKCLNEQYKSYNALNEINNLKFSSLTNIDDNNYSISQFNNLNVNSNYIGTIIKLVIYKRNKVLDSLRIFIM
jgi:hypothetical protein